MTELKLSLSSGTQGWELQTTVLKRGNSPRTLIVSFLVSVEDCTSYRYLVRCVVCLLRIPWYTFYTRNICKFFLCWPKATRMEKGQLLLPKTLGVFSTPAMVYILRTFSESGKANNRNIESNRSPKAIDRTITLKPFYCLYIHAATTSLLASNEKSRP